jgi:hypothetical protein
VQVSHRAQDIEYAGAGINSKMHSSKNKLVSEIIPTCKLVIGKKKNSAVNFYNK